MATTKVNKRLQEAEALLDNPNMKLFQELISRAEATTTHGYNTAFGGSKIESLDDHPRTRRGFTQTDGKKNQSSAAGRYQFIEKTWDALAKRLELPDFSPRSQDLAVIELIRENKALPDILAGNFDAAAGKLGKQFASLPSSKYPQPKRDEKWLAKNIADIQGTQARQILAQTDPGFVANVDSAATKAASGNQDAVAILAAIQEAKTPQQADATAQTINDLAAAETDLTTGGAFGQLVAQAEELAQVANPFTQLPEGVDPLIQDAPTLFAQADEDTQALESVQSLASVPYEMESGLPEQFIAQAVTDENDQNRAQAINSMFRRDQQTNPLMSLPQSIEAMITNFLEKSV